MPVIRVGLTPDPVRSLSIEVGEAFRVQLPGSDRALDNLPRLARTTLVATPRGLKLGQKEYLASRIELVSQKSPAIWVNGHQYRGTIRCYRQSGGTVLAVSELPLEEYIASVIDSEMPAEFGREARVAQAIAARTFALFQKQQAAPNSLTDVSATTRSQKYLGYQYRSDAGKLLAGESADSRKIAADTQGMVCLHGGKLFSTYYCAVCGGATMQGTEFFPDAVPPLKSVPCTWCKPARLYEWSADVSRADLQSDLQKLAGKQSRPLGPVKSVKAVAKIPAGKMPMFEIRDAKQVIKVTGADLRTALAARGVYSPHFTVEDKGTTWHIAGKGHGHGVGMCQWGARGLALEGKTGLQIINYYYPGAKVAVLDYR